MFDLKESMFLRVDDWGQTTKSCLMLCGLTMDVWRWVKRGLCTSQSTGHWLAAAALFGGLAVGVEAASLWR